jgi:hypothetical protein
MIELLPSLGLNNYNTWRILPMKCYIENYVHLRSCIRNINKHFWCRCREEACILYLFIDYIG